MKKIITTSKHILFLIFIIMSSFKPPVLAQDAKPYIRIAKIIVDSAFLDAYDAALKEHAAAAVKKEPGVLTLYAVHDKDDATRITVFEIYLNKDAYNQHIKTAHFLKYKSTVKDMVKSLTLTDVAPIALEAKHKVIGKLKQ